MLAADARGGAAGVGAGVGAGVAQARVEASPVTMADFNSAVSDFFSSRRKGVGGLLGNLLG